MEDSVSASETQVEAAEARSKELELLLKLHKTEKVVQCQFLQRPGKSPIQTNSIFSDSPQTRFWRRGASFIN